VHASHRRGRVRFPAGTCQSWESPFYDEDDLGQVSSYIFVYEKPPHSGHSQPETPYLYFDRVPDGEDPLPSLPEEDKSLEAVHPAGQPQGPALVNRHLCGRGEEGGGRGTLLLLQPKAVVQVVRVEVVLKFIAVA
jgi:hypothetical protein